MGLAQARRSGTSPAYRDGVSLVDRDPRATATVRLPISGYLIAFVYVGMCLSISGPALGHLRDRAGVGIGLSGLLIGGQALGYIAGSLLSGRFYDHGHGHAVLVRAGTVGVAGLVVLTFTHQFSVMVASFVLIGLAAAMMDVGGNTLVVWGCPPGRVGSSLNALHLCFGIGALATPLVVGRSIDVFGNLTLMVALVAVVLVAMTWRVHGAAAPTRRPAAGHDSGTGSGTGSSPQALLLVCVFFFLYVGAEVTFAGWLFTYGEQRLSDDGAASLLVSVFWTGFVVGRVIAVWLARVMSAASLLVSSCLLATVTSVVLGAGGRSGAVVWMTTAFTGLFLGPQFATMMAYGDERLHLTGAATARLVAAAGLGGLVLPVATGWLLQRRGAGALPFTVAAACLASLVAAGAVIAASRQRPPVTSMNAPVT